MNPIITNSISSSIKLKQDILSSSSLLKIIENASQALKSTFLNKNQVLFCGNGGSAGDAQHIAAELSGRFYFDRPPLNAEALHVNSSYLTAVANDYSYDVIYERLVEAKGKKEIF